LSELKVPLVEVVARSLCDQTLGARRLAVDVIVGVERRGGASGVGGAKMYAQVSVTAASVGLRRRGSA